MGGGGGGEGTQKKSKRKKGKRLGGKSFRREGGWGGLGDTKLTGFHFCANIGRFTCRLPT